MSTFHVPFSSSPPTTPDSRPKRSRDGFVFKEMAENPSTTPAGPPPTGASFTPAGPPPSTIFGSSQFGSDVSKLRFTKQIPHHESPLSTTFQFPRSKTGTPAGLLGRNNVMDPSSSILSEGELLDRSETQPPEDEGEPKYEGGQGHHESVRLGESVGSYGRPGSPAFKGFTAVNVAGGQSLLSSSLLESQPSPANRWKLQQYARTKGSIVRSHQLPRKGRADMIPKIARDLANRTQSASLTEPDEMILHTDEIMVELHQQIEKAQDEDRIQDILAGRALELMRLWNSHAPPEQNLGEGIGPGSGATPLQKATYLSSLLLPLRHPPLMYSSASAAGRVLSAKTLTGPGRPMPIPKILVDWLNRYHLSYDDLMEVVRSTQPNCTANEQFWDVAFGMLVRGQISQVIRLFSEADFKHAASAVEDDEDEQGYRGAELQAVQSAVHRARELLRGCPATRGDWQIDSADWDLFRKRVSSHLERLTTSGVSEEDDDNNRSGTLQAAHFGLQKTGQLLPRFAQTAQSQLPWSIYQKLKILYGILVGRADEIIAQSQDWLEATAALTIWWDGAEDVNITTWSINVGRAQVRGNSERPEDPFLARMSAAFLSVTDPEYEDAFQMNSLNPLEIGLASILQGNLEGVLGSLRTYSLTIASTVAEIGSLAGWLEPLQPKIAGGLHEQDLLVLSYGVQAQGISMNDVLLSYAKQLFDRPEFVSEGDMREGWELAISVASRVDDRRLATETITKFIDQMHLDSQERLDKLLALCSSLGMEAEARKVAERFGDHLAANTTNYGPALVCYARSHAPAKIRQLVDLLISYSIIHSMAYPANSDIDDELRILVEHPKRPLSNLNQVDAEAAGMLQFYLAGYACLRRFYNLRDEDIIAKAEGRRPNMKPLARKRAAAKALIAVVNSAADCIYGGLYDAERESAIQVDGLLALLGEVSAFVGATTGGQDHRMRRLILTSAQMYDVLAAVEHLQTVSRRVYEATEDCLAASMRNFLQGSAPPSPRAMLKSVSSGTAASGFSFSMLGSEMWSGPDKGEKSIGGSGVLVPANVDRGWDWRSRFGEMERARENGRENGMEREREVKGEEILAHLRKAIAADLALAEFEEGNCA